MTPAEALALKAGDPVDTLACWPFSTPEPPPRWMPGEYTFLRHDGDRVVLRRAKGFLTGAEVRVRLPFVRPAESTDTPPAAQEPPTHPA